MSHAHFAEVMTSLKKALVSIGHSPNEAQELLNKHYIMLKPTMFVEPTQILALRILKQESPDIACSVLAQRLSKRIEEIGFDVFSLFKYNGHKAFISSLQHVIDMMDYTPRPQLRRRQSKKNDSPHLWEINSFTGTDMYGRTYTGNF